MSEHLVSQWLAAALIVLLMVLIAMGPARRRCLWVPVSRWANYQLDVTSTSSLLLMVCILATFLMGCKLGWAEARQAGQEALEAWGSANLSGIGTVFRVLEGDVAAFRAGYPNLRFLTWLLCFGIPVLTVSTALSALLNFIPRFLPRRQEFLIFSQAEENSIRLAESMMICGENGETVLHPERLAIFLRTKKEKLSPENAARLKKIRAKSYPYTEADLLRIHWRMRYKKLRFFFLASDTDLNFSRMRKLLDEVHDDRLFAQPLHVTGLEQLYRVLRKLKLTKKNGKLENEVARLKQSMAEEEHRGIFRQELYLLSETESSAILIDHLRQDLCEAGSKPLRRREVFAHTDLRLLDRYRTVMYDLLREKPLYENRDDQKIRVLILGFGRVGRAFYRAAASICSMAGFETSFHIRSARIRQAQRELLLEYPQCFDQIDPDMKSMDILSEQLVELLDEHAADPFTYIVVSLGSDETNIQVASKLVRYYRQRYWEKDAADFPVICVNLENEIKSDYVAEFFRDVRHAVPLHVFGSDDHTFSEKMLLDRGMWLAARVLHRSLSQDPEASRIYWSEYERRSSVACAAHAAYHVRAMKALYPQLDYDAAYERLTAEQKLDMIDAEHRRWIRYSRCEGMQGIDRQVADKIRRETGKHVDSIARLTPCIVDTQALPGLYQFLYPKTEILNKKRKAENKPLLRSFYERDRYVVSNSGRLERMIRENCTGEGMKPFEEDPPMEERTV